MYIHMYMYVYNTDMCIFCAEMSVWHLCWGWGTYRHRDIYTHACMHAYSVQCIACVDICAYKCAYIPMAPWEYLQQRSDAGKSLAPSSCTRKAAGFHLDQGPLLDGSRSPHIPPNIMEGEFTDPGPVVEAFPLFLYNQNHGHPVWTPDSPVYVHDISYGP